jgi:preprotein translocase subunit SecA
MTGTAETEAAEFAGTYGLHVVPIPTHRGLARLDQGDLIYKSEEAKFNAVVDDVVERSAKGQPVLIGTISVEKSEKLSRALSKRGVRHEVLNAKLHFREADIVAQAGRLGAVTVATNMAGRGVDILLGGTAEGLAERDVIAEGLDPASEEGQERFTTLLAEYEPRCAADGATVREVGGLYVLGTERHESRRIDNQLRGRSGRQGDPGTSRFYLSLEDELLRLFATGAISWVMDRTMPDDEPIEAKMVTKAIERAQNTVEGRNGEIRKDVLKYDEVMNEQRKVIYGRRHQILEGEDLHERALELIATKMAEVVATHCADEYAEEWNVNDIVLAARNYYPSTVTEPQVAALSDRDELEELLIEDALNFYQTKCDSYPGEGGMAEAIERDVMLQILDQRWRDHLSDMDHLRDGIHLRAMAQQDPLVAWQREGFAMFERLLTSVDDDFVRFIMNIETIAAPSNDSALDGAVTNVEAAPVEASKVPNPSGPAPKAAGSAKEKIGRNDPCFCGSNKKFKQCHGRP